jgi:hypothetical protein
MAVNWMSIAGEIFVEVQEKVQKNPDLRLTPAYKEYQKKADQVLQAIRKGKCSQRLIDQLRSAANNV